MAKENEEINKQRVPFGYANSMGSQNPNVTF